MAKATNGSKDYLAAVSMLRNMLDQRLIDDADYCALETKYTDTFLPLFRYEKPCRNATLPIRQTGKEGRSNTGTHC